MVLQTIRYCCFVSLNRIVVDIHHSLKCLQCHKPDIIFLVHQESAEYIDTEYSESLTGFDSNDGPHTFTEH